MVVLGGRPRIAALERRAARETAAAAVPAAAACVRQPTRSPLHECWSVRVPLGSQPPAGKPNQPPPSKPPCGGTTQRLAEASARPQTTAAAPPAAAAAAASGSGSWSPWLVVIARHEIPS